MKKYLFNLKPVKVPKIHTKNRDIKTSIPAPGSAVILNKLYKYESRSMHGQLPIVWERADNFNIYDTKNNKYIDFTSTIFVANIGHSNKELKKNIKKSIDSDLINSYAYAHKLRADYHKKLVKFAGNSFDKAFLMSSGTESTEAAYKLMKMYGQKIKKRNTGIIAISGNWHGRTTGSQMLSDNIEQNKWISSKDKDIHHIPFPYPWVTNEDKANLFLAESIKKLEQTGIDLKKDISGLILETFQGWGAVFYPKSYVKAIKELCQKNNILLTFDEMQSGFARTGRAFGFMHYEVVPDLICCGKGMGGGIPISGVIGRKEIMDLPEIGNMSSTHSANPLACIAGLTVLDEIKKNNLIKETQRKGKLLFYALNEIKNQFSDHIKYVLGKGLIVSIIFHHKNSNKPNTYLASAISERCMQKGLLVVHTGRESIKIGPPLTITDEALIEGVEVIREAIKELV